MFWDRLMSMFKNSSNKVGSAQKVYKGPTKHQRGVEPKHIGDLGEYKLDVQLRQFSKENKYLNDILIVNPRSKTGYAQIDHVLITPYGLFVIEVKNYSGYIRGKRDDWKWKLNGKYDVYNPVQQNRTHINALKRILTEWKDLKYVSVISFTKRCQLNVDPELREIDSDDLVVYDIKLTDYIEGKLRRFKAGNPNPPLLESDVARIFEVIGQRNVTDPKMREEHNRKAGAISTTN